MFTICILFITLTTKTKGMREGASEKLFRPQKLYRAGTAPPGSYISGSATSIHMHTITLCTGAGTPDPDL